MDKFKVSVVKNKIEVIFLIKILNFSILITFKFKIFKFDKEIFYESLSKSHFITYPNILYIMFG